MEAGRYLPFCVRRSDGDYIEDDGDLEEELMTTGSAKERAEYPSDQECEDIRDWGTVLKLNMISAWHIFYFTWCLICALG